MVHYLRILLVIRYVYPFHIWVVTLYQYILVRIRILSREESSLCLSFPPIFYHSLFRSWAFTLRNMRYSFESSNYMVHTLGSYTLLYILLLRYCLFELDLLLQFQLLVCQNWVLRCTILRLLALICTYILTFCKLVWWVMLRILSWLRVHSTISQRLSESPIPSILRIGWILLLNLILDQLF